MYDHHLPGAAVGAVSGKSQYPGPTPNPPQGSNFAWDWTNQHYQFFPHLTVVDNSAFPGGNMLDPSVSNVTDPVLSGLGYDYAYNPITGTGGMSRPSDPSFLSTAWSPIHT